MIVPIAAALLFLISVLTAVLTDFSVPRWAAVLACLLLFKKPKLAALLFALLLGFFRVDMYENQESQNPPVGEYRELEGSVVAEVDARSDHKKITIETEFGRVLAKVSIYDDIAFGDRVLAAGMLERPYEGEEFSYGNYLARYRTWLVMNRADITVLEKAGFSVRGALYQLKEVLQNRINRLYFEPEASFVSGLLLGSRKGMSEELALAFQKAGLTHIVAVSGYNISLVIAAIFALFSFLPFKRRIFMSAAAVALFVFFVGASSAAVRAGIMGSITMWGLYSGRRSQAFFALLWSAVGMTFWNPYILVYDIGFQLSVASTFGLLTLVPLLGRVLPIGRFLLKYPKLNFFREAFLLTLSAQIATFPIMVFNFGTISLVAPLVNVLVAPFIPLSMLFSGISLLIGLPGALVASFYLKIIEGLARFFSDFSFAQIPIQLNAFGFVFSIGVLFTVIVFSYKSTLARAFRF